MSFGFGVGDFYTAATLAWRISVALRGRDRSESVELLISELEFTAQALHQSGTLLDNINCHNDVDDATKNVVGLGLSRCKEELMKLDKIVKKYQRGSSSKPIYLQWVSVPSSGVQNLKWEFCAKDGVNQLRENISKGLIQINFILSVSKV